MLQFLLSQKTYSLPTKEPKLQTALCVIFFSQAVKSHTLSEPDQTKITKQYLIFKCSSPPLPCLRSQSKKAYEQVKFNLHKYYYHAKWQRSHFLFMVVAFSLLTRILGESLTIHSSPALFFFLKWRLARTHEFHFLGQDQSTIAQWPEMTVAECFLSSCMWAHFLIGSHTVPGQQHSQPTLTL